MLFTTIDIALLSTFGFCFIIQILFLWIYLAKPYFVQRKQQPIVENEPAAVVSDSGMFDLFSSEAATCVPVSVIICAQDDNVQLLEERFLSILEQDYPQFELIIVNDGLSEEADDLLKRLKNQYRNFYFTRIPEGTKNISRKKLGLTLGIKAAKYDVLLFTESDSAPVGKKWISGMASHFTDKKSIVLAFGVLKKRNGFGNRYSALDYLYTNIQILCMALFNRPYGANGRNMAYKKQHFIDHKGFSRFRFLQSGADDLFVNEVASPGTIGVDVSKESVIETDWDSPFYWKDWKIKRALTKGFYRKTDLLLWRFEALSRLLFMGLAVYLISTNLFALYISIPVFVLCLVRLASLLFVINKTAKNLNISRSYLLLTLFDAIQIFTNVYYYFYAMIKKKDEYTWNIGK